MIIHWQFRDGIYTTDCTGSCRYQALLGSPERCLKLTPKLVGVVGELGRAVR